MTHGTETCYVHHRCRCVPSRNAATEARRGRVKTEKRVGKERGAETVFKHELEHEWVLQRLCHDPAYRELIRQRISDAQKRRRRSWASMARWL